MLSAAPSIMQIETTETALTGANSRISATTSVKIEEDSEMAWPTSMVLKISPEALGCRAMAAVASEAM